MLVSFTARDDYKMCLQVKKINFQCLHTNNFKTKAVWKPQAFMTHLATSGIRLKRWGVYSPCWALTVCT